MCSMAPFFHRLERLLLFCILAYAALLAILGRRYARGVKGSADFFVAGRDLSSPLLFGTFLAANLGAGTTVGAAEFGYRSGLSAWWWVGSAGLGSLVLAFFVGPKIHQLAAHHNLYTVGDYLELRYSRAVRLLMAGLLWIGSLAILAGQLIAMGVVLDVAAGLPHALGVGLGGLIVTVYFASGGLWGSARINLLQVAVKVIGFCVAVPWALYAIGGWDGLGEQIASTAADPVAYQSITGIGAAGIARYAVILVPAFFVSPGLLQKLYGARDATVVRRAVGTQGVVLLLYSILPVLLGMIAFAHWPELENPDLALPKLMAERMPAAIGGLMLAAIFSAEISSADAVLFMLSTSVARDLVQPLSGGRLDDAGLLRVARLAAVGAGIAGVALALQIDSILSALTIFYSLLTVTLFVPLLGGLYLRRPTASAALAAMTAAIGVTLAAHAATAGAGWGILTPSAAGIVLGGVVYLLFAYGRRGARSTA